MSLLDKITETEVCIIGAGAAGGIMAWELARRGIKVVVLESGPRHDFKNRFEYAKRLYKGDNPWLSSIKEIDHYTTSGNLPYYLNWYRGRGVGGSTLYWEAFAIRLHENDFKLRSLYGIADDWPISYADLEPYYVKAERALGVAGKADDPWVSSQESTPFPLPPFAFSYSDRFFEKGCKSLGITFHHLNKAINSKPYADRPQCQACGTCHVCPIGAKASIDLTHIPQAEATGNANVLTDVTVLRLETDRSNKVSNVVYAGHDKFERRLSANLFVVAAGGVETSRLLLLSASKDFPNGLANKSGMVGKYFMSHPVIDVTGRMKEKVYPYRIGFSTAMTRQFAIDRNRAKRGAFFMEFLNSVGLPARIAFNSKKWGEDLRNHVRQEFGYTLGVRVFCEQLPDANNSVSLNYKEKDYFGTPVPHITYNIGHYERATLEEAKGVAKDILQTIGASKIQSHDLHYAAHQIGTHRMGKDPQTSVVNDNLRAHDISNLYLVGSGSFVTSSSSPPTLTIAALAIRAAEHIASIR